MRWWQRIGLGVLVVLVAGVAAVFILSNAALHKRWPEHPETLAATGLPLAEVERRARTLGCLDCHSEGMRGKAFLAIPQVATLHAPNIPLIAANATDQQLARAIRQGIGVDGRALFIMPSLSYRHLTDQETGDLIRFIRSLPAGGVPSPKPAIGPLGRIGLLQGKFPTQPELIAGEGRRRLPDFGAATANGRHLVETHCGDCHGPILTGGTPEDIKAPDLTIAAAYDDPAFARLLRTGVPADGRKLKLMGDVSRNDFAHFTDAEIAAIHAYLKARADAATN